MATTSNDSTVRGIEDSLERLERAISNRHRLLEKSFADLFVAIRSLSSSPSVTSPPLNLQQTGTSLASLVPNQQLPDPIRPSRSADTQAIRLLTPNRASPLNDEARRRPVPILPVNFSEPDRQTRTGTTNTYSRTNRLARLDIPRFSGDKVQEWLIRVEQFFDIDRTPDDLKIGLVSVHLDDVAATWHQSIVQSALGIQRIQDWQSYKSLLKERFDDPIVELLELQETAGLLAYHEKFQLKNVVTGTDLECTFLAGLQTDTQLNITMFQPQTVSQCLMNEQMRETGVYDELIQADEDLKIMTEGSANVPRIPGIVVVENDSVSAKQEVTVADSQSLSSIMSSGPVALESTTLGATTFGKRVENNEEQFGMDYEVSELMMGIHSISSLDMTDSDTRALEYEYTGLLTKPLEDNIFSETKRDVIHTFYGSDNSSALNIRWNVYANFGVEPSLHTYDALVDGCAIGGQLVKTLGAYESETKKLDDNNCIWDPGGVFFTSSIHLKIYKRDCFVGFEIKELAFRVWHRWKVKGPQHSHVELLTLQPNGSIISFYGYCRITCEVSYTPTMWSWLSKKGGFDTE